MNTDTTKCKRCSSIAIHYAPVPADTIKCITNKSCPKCDSKNVQAGVIPSNTESQTLLYVFCNSCGFKYGKISLEDVFLGFLSGALHCVGVTPQDEEIVIRGIVRFFNREAHPSECVAIQIPQEDLDFLWTVITDRWNLPPNPLARSEEVEDVYKFYNFVLSDGVSGGRGKNCEGNFNRFFRWPLKIFVAAGWVKEDTHQQCWRLR